MSVGAVHQVLATLGYGDAIGHEVLGIQRVLRAAGYDSEIFVETADPRLEDLTYDYRDLRRREPPDNLLLHHFSIGSRASRVAFALPDRMALIYHNITPPQYFVGVHDKLVRAVLEGTPRAWRATSTAATSALGDSEFNRRRAGGASASRARACFLSSRTSPIWTPRLTCTLPARSTTSGRTCCSWAALVPNKRIEQRRSASFTPTGRASTRARGCCWSARTAASRNTWRCSRA